MQTGARRALGEILLEMGVLDRGQLRVGLVHHHEVRVPLGRALVREGICSEAEVLRALSAQLGVGVVDLDRQPPDRSLVRLIPRKVAMQHRVVPLRLEREEREILHVALPAPASIEALDAVRAVSGKPRVTPHLASDAALARALAGLYGLEVPREPSPDPVPSASPRAPVLLYGWPAMTVLLITRALARHGVQTRTASPLEVLHTVPGDIVFAPLQAMEGLLAGEARISGSMVVHGDVGDEDFERARQLGAKGFVVDPRDDELLLRAIRRLRPNGGDPSPYSEQH